MLGGLHFSPAPFSPGHSLCFACRHGQAGLCAVPEGDRPLSSLRPLAGMSAWGSLIACESGAWYSVLAPRLPPGSDGPSSQTRRDFASNSLVCPRAFPIVPPTRTRACVCPSAPLFPSREFFGTSPAARSNHSHLPLPNANRLCTSGTLTSTMSSGPRTPGCAQSGFGTRTQTLWGMPPNMPTPSSPTEGVWRMCWTHGPCPQTEPGSSICWKITGNSSLSGECLTLPYERARHLRKFLRAQCKGMPPGTTTPSSPTAGVWRMCWTHGPFLQI